MGMARDDHREELTTGQLLQTARHTFMSLHMALIRKVDAIAWAQLEVGRDERATSEAADAAEGDVEAKAAGPERQKALQAHIASLQKSLEMVMDCERKLERIIAERAGRRSGDVDLDAARREILGELARLAERG